MQRDIRSSRRLAPWRRGAIGTLALLIALPAAGAGMPVFDATNLAQNLISAIQQTINVSQQVSQLTNEASMITNQVEQLAHELQMLEDMWANSRHAADLTWGDVDQMMATLANTVQLGMSISYAMEDLATAFPERFPGYQTPVDWNAAYRDWSQTALDSMQATLQAAGLNVADAPSVDAALAALREENRTAEGRMEALQVANQLASMQIEEVTKLRGLVATQISAQNAYFATQEDKRAAAEAAASTWISRGVRPIPIAFTDAGFDAVPRP
jgi:P-type conjugative transfer protein TrbJ